MNNNADPDWGLIRAFLSVAESGSLSAAARDLGVSQPTLSRQMRTAEIEFGGPLFRRHSRGLELTETGRDLLEDARQMKAAAQRFGMAAAGCGAELKGTVRLAASTTISHHLLPTILAGLRAETPDIQIELNPDDFSDNILFREADIAVRMYRPKQLDLVAREIAHLPMGMFAARQLIERIGMPRTHEDLMQADWVGFDKSDVIVNGMRSVGLQVDRSFFATRCDDHAICIEMVRAGCGIGIIPNIVADRLPDLVPVIPDFPIPKLPMWLVAHEALRHTPRIRRVWDRLAEGLTCITAAAP